MVLSIRPAFRPILLGGLAALVCGSVVAVGMLPAKVSEHARKAERSATGSRLQIAVTAPAKAPVPAAAGKLATMPDNYADAGAAGSLPPAAVQSAANSRGRGGARRLEEAVVADDDEDVAVAPRYARAEARWRRAAEADEDDAYDQPPLADPPARYRSYREEARRDREPRRFDDRYVAAPYPGEGYYPPYGR